MNIVASAIYAALIPITSSLLMGAFARASSVIVAGRMAVMVKWRLHAQISQVSNGEGLAMVGKDKS